MRKIRILVDAHIFDKEPQGTRTFIREIYRILSKDSTNFEFFFVAYNVSTLQTVFPFVKEENFIKLISRSSFIRLSFEIPYIIKKFKIDYAHFQYVVPPIKFCNYIITTHDILFYEFPDDFSFLYKKVNGFLFKKSSLISDIVTTVSSYSKESISRYFGISGENVSILPNGVNENFFESYSKVDSANFIFKKYKIQNYILFVSRVEARKNHEFLLDAYLALRLYERGLQLVFIGKNSVPVKSFGKKMSSLPLKVKENVFWLQEIEDEDLIEFYKAARVFVYPSKAEGFGIPPLEAAALRVPTLCSSSTAMSDFKFLGPNTFDPNNLNDLMQKLDKVLLDPPDSYSLSTIANFVKENYSWNVAAEKFKKIILSHFAQNENSNTRN